MELDNNYYVESPKIAFFNFDNTLFDNYHALLSGLAAIRDRLPEAVSETMTNRDLAKAYASAHPWPIFPLDRYTPGSALIQWPWGRGPGGADSPYGGYETFHPNAFLPCCRQGQPRPDPATLRSMAETYESAYMANRRPLQGTLETLIRMREDGCYVVFHYAPWALPAEYEDKAKALGIRDLVDRLVPTSLIGMNGAQIMAYSKREIKKISPIHDGAVVWIVGAHGARVMLNEDLFGITSYVVGDENQREANSRLDEGGRVRRSYGTRHVYSDMKRLPHHLGLATDLLHTVIVPKPRDEGRVFVKGLGIDVITHRRMTLPISKAQAQYFVSMAGVVLSHVAHRRSEMATSCLEKVIRAVERATQAPQNGNDYETISEGDEVPDPTPIPMCLIELRQHSFRAEHQRLVVPTVATQNGVFQEAVKLLEMYLFAIMTGKPQAAVDQLHEAISALRRA